MLTPLQRYSLQKTSWSLAFMQLRNCILVDSVGELHAVKGCLHPKETLAPILII